MNNTAGVTLNTPLRASGVSGTTAAGSITSNTLSAVLNLSVTNANSKLMVYPNPVKDLAVISVPDQMLGHRLKLADATGKTWQVLTIISAVFTIDMHTYGAGTYLLQTYDGNTYKIIKQ